MGGVAPDIQRIGRYNIVSTLGEGAMGVVYEGLDTRLHRKVAIKRILKSALDSDSAKEYSARFAREAQAVARLNHPNIVQVFDFAEEGDVAYIVMEFVRGKELKTFFDAREKFALKEVVHIVGELCEALNFAHNAGIVHRDIKPANVMIDHGGRVKLTDFGVARFTDPDRTQSDKTQAGAIVGTPAYMSPEQIQGETLDRRTDIFSAGIILYEFLTGGKPFTGQGAWTIAKKILQDEPPPPSSIDKTIAPVYDAIVARALAKNRDARYQTARDFGMALKRALEGLPEIDEAEKTVILGPGALQGLAPGGPSAAETTVPLTQPKAVELEFWRSIKDGSDPADFDLYLQQFPSGIYAALARRKIAKLRGASGDETVASSEVEKKEAEEAARREGEARAKLAAEKAELEARLAQREAEMAKREAELRKKAEDAEKAAAEAPRKTPLAAVLATLAAAGAIAYAWYALKPPDTSAERVAQLTKMLEESKRREAELVQSRQRELELKKELELARQRAAEAEKAGDVARQRELAEQVRQREAEAAKQAELTRQRAEALRKQAEAAEKARLQVEAGKKAPAPAKVEIAKATEAPRAPEPPKPEPPKVEAKAPEPTKLAAIPAPSPEAPQSPEAMLQRAIALEGEGKNREARRLLEGVTRQASGQVAGQAAKRLGDMLAKGVPGVQRDYGEALRFYEIARLNGIEVQTTKGR